VNISQPKLRSEKFGNNNNNNNKNSEWEPVATNGITKLQGEGQNHVHSIMFGPAVKPVQSPVRAANLQKLESGH